MNIDQNLRKYLYYVTPVQQLLGVMATKATTPTSAWRKILYTPTITGWISFPAPACFIELYSWCQRRRDGRLAQDVEQTLKDIGVPFKGLVVDDEDKTLDLSCSDFVIPLINSAKELQQCLVQLEETAKQLQEKQ